MTQEEYINSLTTEELRYVVNQFWEWYNNDGCPATCYPKYKCQRENTSDCDEEREVLEGCWVKYFVWKYREQNGETEMAELSEFERLVREMRTAQRAYFRSRSSGALEASKRLEREVDAFLKARREEIEAARLAANMEFDFSTGGKE